MNRIQFHAINQKLLQRLTLIDIQLLELINETNKHEFSFIQKAKSNQIKYDNYMEK